MKFTFAHYHVHSPKFESRRDTIDGIFLFGEFKRKNGKEFLLTGHDIVTDNLHVAIAIRSGMLVPKTDYVAQLVHHYPKLVAILPDTYRLRPVSSLPDERAASVVKIVSDETRRERKGKS